MMKLWILTNTPSPYQLEFFQAIHDSRHFDLDARFMRATHRGSLPLRPGDVKFPCAILDGLGPASWRDEFRVHPQALKEAAKGDYDFFILSGHYTSVTFILCALLLRIRRKPWAMWLERPWPENYRPDWSQRITSRSRMARWVRRALLRFLYRLSEGLFCIGTLAEKAYREMGAPANKLYLLPYFCNLKRFARVDANTAAQTREELGITKNKALFLFSGALIERKGVDILLKAFQQVASKHQEATLVILGDGPLRKQLEDSLPTELKSRLHFMGHLKQKEIPPFFAAADVFVFPSRHDGWGVVINEACGAGLPVITCDSVGAAHDLVQNEHNGFISERDDIEALAKHMEFFIRQRAEVARFGYRSLQMAKSFTLEEGVALLKKNIDEVLNN